MPEKSADKTDGATIILDIAVFYHLYSLLRIFSEQKMQIFLISCLAFLKSCFFK